MKRGMRRALGFVVLLIPSIGRCQAPVVIDFDNLSAPCDFASALPLSGEYAAVGVDFVESAAVLGECSGFGVPGYSPPNFVVLDANEVLPNGRRADVLSMAFEGVGLGPRRVRVRMGGTPGTRVGLYCDFCGPWGPDPSCSRAHEVVLGSGMRTLEVSADVGFVYCQIGGDTSAPGPERWIIDDIELDFQQQAAPVPGVSSFGLVAFALLIGLLGGVLLSRGRG